MPCIHELFEAQALARPGATAVSFEDERGGVVRATYAELDRRSSALARLLIESG